jgi:AP-3 complex subunit delta
MERLFRKSMHDLVKGLRSHQDREEEFIQKCLVEIRAELDGKNPEAKAAAVQKLTYLQMFGYEMSFASFRVVEVMNQPKFTSKRLGYLAASQSFNEDTEVALLTAALFTKEFVSTEVFQAGLALNCLANIMTKDLARGLAQNLVGLLTTSRPYVRKRAVLCMYPLFRQFPQALRPAFPRLKEKLDDPEMGVQSAAANVICELARKNPRNYLSLAPVFFRILTQSNNTWMLIKVIKLFGALCPLERRLGKKLVEPLSNMINTTSAVSLLYECINTCIVGLPGHTGLIRLCITKLRALVESADPNLKYLGLVALHKIMLVHPKAVVEHRQMVIGCLDGQDESIRVRALELLTGMVRQRNLMEIVQKLMVKCDEAEQPYKDEVLRKIIEICSQKNYQYVTDFEWYLEVLMELTHVKGSRFGKLISAQFLDVATRVHVIRPLAVHHMTTLLRDPRLMENQTAGDTSSQVLYAAAYICGEFSEHVRDVALVLESMLNPRVATLAPRVQVCFPAGSIPL